MMRALGWKKPLPQSNTRDRSSSPPRCWSALSEKPIVTASSGIACNSAKIASWNDWAKVMALIAVAVVCPTVLVTMCGLLELGSGAQTAPALHPDRFQHEVLEPTGSY